MAHKFLPEGYKGIYIIMSITCLCFHVMIYMSCNVYRTGMSIMTNHGGYNYISKGPVAMDLWSKAIPRPWALPPSDLNGFRP